MQVYCPGRSSNILRATLPGYLALKMMNSVPLCQNLETNFPNRCLFVGLTNSHRSPRVALKKFFPFLAGSPFTVILFGLFWSSFWFSFKRGHFYFDPQDLFRADPKTRVLPASASTATFEPLLKHYIGVTQLLVTVAAASIAFGGNSQSLGTAIVIAKLLLAWSIFYGVLFCAVLLWRYDEYAQDMESYTLFWYSTVFALGFSSMTCFMFGYLAWGWGLS